MPGQLFHQGDLCFLDLEIDNPGISRQVDLYLLLAYEDEFWAYPSWLNISQGLDSEAMMVGNGTYLLRVIPEFVMPAVPVAGPFHFFAGMFRQGELSLDALVSNGAQWEFFLD
jgi:hypothetical protein